MTEGKDSGKAFLAPLPWQGLEGVQRQAILRTDAVACLCLPERRPAQVTPHDYGE